MVHGRAGYAAMVPIGHGFGSMYQAPVATEMNVQNKDPAGDTLDQSPAPSADRPGGSTDDSTSAPPADRDPTGDPKW